MKKILIIAIVLVGTAVLAGMVVVILRGRAGAGVATPSTPSGTAGMPSGGTAPPVDTTTNGMEEEETPIAAPRCGDFRCDANESSASCPEDCVLAETEELDARISFPGSFDPNDTASRVAVRTNVPVRGVLRYGPTEQYGGGTVTVDEYQFDPVFVIEGIEPGSNVYYSVTVTDEAGASRVLNGIFEK